MFGFERFDLLRFSLGAQYNTIPVEATMLEEMGQVSGVAIPVETTMFVNDVLRMSARGAIAVRTAFESRGELNTSVRMHANMVFSFRAGDALCSSAYGSQDRKLILLWCDTVNSSPYAYKDMPSSAFCAESLHGFVDGSKYIPTSGMPSEVLTSVTSAATASTEQTSVTVIIPPGGELRIDSETYRAILDGANVLHEQSGDWIWLSRDLVSLTVEAAGGGGLAGTVIYQERYL